MIHPINFTFVAVCLSPADMTVLRKFSDNVSQFALEHAHSRQIHNMLWESIVDHDTVEQRGGIQTVVTVHLVYKRV